MSSMSCRSQCGSGSSRSSSFCSEQPQYPFYPFVDHPLVYYAQVPECCGFKQRMREKKDNPNCFVRAFRWYTQEHNVQKNSANEMPVDTAGFATWLDRKYDQFLNDSCQNSSVVSRQRVTSSIRIVTNKPCKMKTDKYKKSWGRRRATSSRNGGDCRPGKLNQSFEIILQPKDLSRPASECCFQNRQETCCEPRATVISSDTEVMSRNSKLQNYATVIEGKEIRVRPVPENAKARKLQDNETVVLTRTLNSASSLNEKKRHSVLCQCPDEQEGTAEASTQYDVNDLECVPPTLEQPMKTEQNSSQECQSFPTIGCECRKEISTQCFPEESTQVLELNNGTEKNTTIHQEKDTALALLQNSEVKFSEAVYTQQRKMSIVNESPDAGKYCTQNTQSIFKIKECNECRNNHDTELKASLEEEQIKSNEQTNTLQCQSNRKISVVNESMKLESCCKIQPELKSAVCDVCNVCKMYPLNQIATTITTQSGDKVTTSALSEQHKMASNEQISLQRPNVRIHSTTQLVISESKTSEFDVCKPCRLNSKITDKKISYIQENVIESPVCQEAKVNPTEKVEIEKPQSYSKTMCGVCPPFEDISESQHLQPESKCDVCKTCKVNNGIETTTIDQEKVKYNEKMDTRRPSLKTSVICGCPKVSNFSNIRQSQPESKVPECKVCKVNKNIEMKTFCDQEKIIKEPVGNSVDIKCKCPRKHKEVNQRKFSKMIPTKQATVQTSDYSICLDKSLPGDFPLLMQVVTKRQKIIY